MLPEYALLAAGSFFLPKARRVAVQENIGHKSPSLGGNMFIYSIRATTLKFFASLLLVVTVLAVLVALGTADSVYASADGKEINYSGIKTNEDRVAFIESFGIKVKPTPMTEETFTMPEDFDRVILGYNQIQKTQGLDLTKYSRKRVTHFAYEVTNYNAEGTVTVNLLVCRGRIIAADISSASDGGFVSSLVDFDRSKLK